MPADVALARREGVELVRTGTWAASTGTWTPTKKDILAAVEAMKCPAVGKPILTIGHLDERFTPRTKTDDGEPGIGWVDNLRAGEDGDLLLGDYVGVPAWIDGIMASAWPKRSIEGKYNYRCALNHRHDFALEAVSLLGKTPPAIPTLRSLNDVAELYGVDIAASAETAGEPVYAVVMAGRHAFDEHKVKRDGDGKFSHTASNDGPAPKAEAKTPTAAPLKDALKLASRIKLGDGETFIGSGAVKDAGIAVAAIDGPDGPKVRLGVNIDPSDIGSWRAANKGSTVELDADGVAALQSAIPGMLDMAEQGIAHYKALDKRDRELTARERELINRQYPNLSKAGGKQLEQIDNAIFRVTGSDTSRLENQRRRVGDLPDDKQRERATALLDKFERQRVAGEDTSATELELRSIMWGRSAAEVREITELNADPFNRTDEQKARYAELKNPQSGLRYEWAFFFDRDMQTLKSNRAEMAQLTADRGRLTEVSRPLSDADAAELEQVRKQLDSNGTELGEFSDGGFLVDGVIPGKWGDLVYEVTMAGERPQVSLDVRPPDAGPDWYGHGDESLELADLRKLPALLGRATAVKASAGQGEDAAVHTGAMVALIPTAEDAERLAVEGGESAEELHVTLAYLGAAADLGAQGKQDIIDAVSTAANGLPLLEASVFSAAVFNPGDAEPDRDPCLVYGLSGDMLDAVHDLVDDALFGQFIDAPIPSQHRPWVAHVTAAYTGELAKLAELTGRMGPVRFDRLRLAFAGEHIDIPLIEWPADDAETDDADMVAAAAGNAEQLRSYWTKDPRGLAKWRDKPHPFTALYRHLKRFLSDDRAKRTAASWYHDVLGKWPGAKKGVKASEELFETPELPTPVLPAAEPEQPINKEDPVSLSDDMRSRLGLAEGAEEPDALKAIDELIARADKTPEPTPEMVAASAAATEKADRAEQAQALLKDELGKVRDELNTIKASAAQTVKASAFDGWLATGRLKPADKETWEARYDRDPEMVTEILGGRSENSEVPVVASGVTGDPEPSGADTQFEADYARHFGADEKASA
jgi:2'-5' RNA ligase